MDLVGNVLAGRYEILEEIGKGGMAHVYKARCQLLNRFVAIKVLKEEFKDDKEFVRRFNIEAQAAASISNPHVVSIYDVGCEKGLYYIVMEYIEGVTLKEYIAEKGTLPWRQAAEFAVQICDGLEEAHKNSVIHRDIKPQNIIITHDGVLKVTDFGIARANSQATMTIANSTIGTVHYLSPEQARGGYTDQRTDIYSLGVVLYEMLTGKLPFNDTSPVAIAIKHIQEAPVPPAQLNSEIPAAMEFVVLKAMNKEQSMRYSSAAAFMKDLQAVLANPQVVLGKDAVATPEPSGDDVTTKLPNIDDRHMEEYHQPRKDPLEPDENSEKYSQYAREVDNAVEERKLRDIEEKKKIREQKKKERRITLIAILAAVLVIAGVATAFSVMTGGGGIFAVGERIEIPNVVDMDLDKAQNKYKDSFSIVKKSEKQSDKSAGAILEQSPAAGEKVKKRDDIVIYVVVSSGNDKITMAGYVGQTFDEAKKNLEKDGFKVNKVERYSDSEEKDKVLSQDPAEGSSVSPGGLVTLYVSKGKEDAKASDAPTATASAKPSDSPSSRPSTAPETTSTKRPTSSNTDDDNQGGSTGGNSGGTSGGNSGGNTTSGGTSGGTTGGSSSGENTSGGSSSGSETGGSSSSTTSAGSSGSTTGGSAPGIGD